jgi:hypothetical protein
MNKVKISDLQFPKFTNKKIKLKIKIRFTKRNLKVKTKVI